MNKRICILPQGQDVAPIILAKQPRKTSVPVWYLNCLLESSGRRWSCQRDSPWEILTGTQKRSIAFLTPAASKYLQRMQGLHLALRATRASGQVPTAMNQFFNLTFSLGLTTGIAAQTRKQEEPLCDYYHRKKFRGWNRKDNSNSGGRGKACFRIPFQRSL